MTRSKWHKPIACPVCGEVSLLHHSATACAKCKEAAREWVCRCLTEFDYAKCKRGGPTFDGRPCVDCGKPATGLDHRDYTRPLDVVPICHACNKRRGAAYPFIPGAIAHIDLSEIEYQAHAETPAAAAPSAP